jgi:hypothetical protein
VAVPVSPHSNFDFLEAHDPLLARLPSLAERYVHDDPNTAILKVRQFAELLARQAAARLNLDASPEIEQFKVIHALVFAWIRCSNDPRVVSRPFSLQSGRNTSVSTISRSDSVRKPLVPETLGHGSQALNQRCSSF